MPYSTGQVADFAGLRDVLSNAGTAHGWTWNASKSTLCKGHCAVQLTLPDVHALRVRGGTGVDSDGALVNPATYDSQLHTGTAFGITWPVTYHLFVYDNPDLIVVTINHGVTYWQWLMFGLAINLGATGIGGDTPFVYASVKGSTIYSPPRINLTYGNAGSGGYANHPALPFWSYDGAGNSNNTELFRNAHLYVGESAAFTHSGQPVGWSPDGLATTLYSSTSEALAQLLRQPNGWNGQAVLHRLRVAIERPDGFWSYVAELPHMRVLRNDNVDDRTILTLGTDRWMVIPGRCKNSTAREGDYNADHSGTYALAMAYTP